MLVLDDAAVYTGANEAACQVLGRCWDDIVGRRMGFTTETSRRSQLYELWEECRRTRFVIVPWQRSGYACGGLRRAIEPLGDLLAGQADRARRLTFIGGTVRRA
jgi:hypothetical protein